MNNPWFLIPTKAVQPRIRLLCFAHAGSGPAVFHRWVAHLPEWIEVRAIQLPGRGLRLREPPFRDLSTLAQVAAPELIQSDVPYAMFGHSLGATIAFEIAREARRRGLAAPERLFVSSRPAPTVTRDEPPIHHLPDAQFLEALRTRYGEADAGLRHPELVQLMLPALKADMQMLETWRCRDEAGLSIPVHVYAAEQDQSVAKDHLERWREVAAGEYSLQWLPGDHFHYANTPQPLISAIVHRLSAGQPER